MIRRTIEEARARALPVALVTFEPHPLRVILGDGAPPQLTSLHHKLECFADLGVDLALVMPFTRETAELPPEDFVRDILVKCLNIRALVVGHDYAFGKGRRGDARLLQTLGEAHGYSLAQLPPVLAHEDVVSSTRIREALSLGEAEVASDLLGRPHSVEGTVEHGMNRGGKLLGFPTANLHLGDNLLLPKTGVYGVFAEINPVNHILPGICPGSGGKYLRGVANVGRNPTFGDNNLHVETHLLDFHGNIYGAAFRLHFIKRLRDEQKFNGITELVAQIRNDCHCARALLSRQL